MKIGFFITARLKSTKLKQKILLNLNGKSIIDRVIERCKIVKGLNGVVLCTSKNSQDSILNNYAYKNEIHFFAGSEDDVLDRLLCAANYYKYDAFLSITADNPLFSIYFSQIAVDWYRQKKFDFIFMKGLPIGCTSYFINTKALQVANFMKKESNTEIWGPFVDRDDFFKIGEIIVKNSPYSEETRLTCDYSEDYNLLKLIYGYFSKNYIPRIQEVFNILKENPELLEINKMKEQQVVNKNKLNTINANFTSNIKKGLNYANQINKKLLPSREQLKIKI